MINIERTEGRTVYCERPGCTALCTVEVRGKHTLDLDTAVKHVAELAGWKFSPWRAWCPEHVPEDQHLL